MKPHKIGFEQCDAARDIESTFGTLDALAYLIGEKFINFLETAEEDAAYRAEIPEFVAEIKEIFEPWQLAEYLNSARQTEPFDPTVYDDPDDAELEKRRELWRSASELLLVEKAREWLLGE